MIRRIATWVSKWAGLRVKDIEEFREGRDWCGHGKESLVKVEIKLGLRMSKSGKEVRSKDWVCGWAGGLARSECTCYLKCGKTVHYQPAPSPLLPGCSRANTLIVYVCWSPPNPVFSKCDDLSLWTKCSKMPVAELGRLNLAEESWVFRTSSEILDSEVRLRPLWPFNCS